MVWTALRKGGVSRRFGVPGGRACRMYCLLCHQKISRWRRMKTSSQFCCDEHAEQHKREAMGRLMEYAPAAPSASSDPKTDTSKPPAGGLM